MQHTLAPCQLGFSLVESVMALGLVAGLVGMAVPQVQDMLHASALRGATGELVADLVQARSEALMRNRRVALCKSASGQHCETEGGWEQGWMMFHDENGNGVVDAAEEVISRRAALAPQFRLQGNQPVAKYISYTALGSTKLTGGAFQAGTLTLCRHSAGPTPARQIIVNSIGRPRVEAARVDSCG